MNDNLTVTPINRMNLTAVEARKESDPDLLRQFTQLLKERDPKNKLNATPCFTPNLADAVEANTAEQSDDNSGLTLSMVAIHPEVSQSMASYVGSLKEQIKDAQSGNANAATAAYFAQSMPVVVHDGNVLMPSSQSSGGTALPTLSYAPVAAALSCTGSVYTQSGVELTNQGDTLCYRLLNGPLMGLVIQAGYQQQGVVLQIFPSSGRQAQAFERVLPELNKQLQGRRADISLELMPISGQQAYSEDAE